MTDKSPARIPWIRYSEDVNRQLAEHAGDTRIRIPARVLGTDEEMAHYNRTAPRNAAPAVAVPHRATGPSDAQWAFIGKLLDEIGGEHAEAIRSTMRTAVTTTRQASVLIDALKATRDALREQRTKAPAAAPAPRPAVDQYEDVPDGYYALRNDEGHVAFYRVSTMPPRGQYTRPARWVNRQASDDLHPMTAAQRNYVLAAIRAVGADNAGALYGQEIGSCWVCHRALTDDASRAAGIGPTCAAKRG